MRKTLIFLFGVIWIVCTSSLFSQEIQVSDPRLELRDNSILISYDILNSTPSEKFTVELIVTDSKGNRINAAALSGDVGKMVYGGTGKRIVWDLEVDKIEMNAQIYVKVYVKAIPPPEPVVDEPVIREPEKEPKETATDDAIPESILTTPGVKRFNRTSLVLQSVAFPGLGLSRYRGGPHWIKGMAGYGCIAGSVVMNRKAISTYKGINDLTGFDEKNTLYKESVQQDHISEVLAYTAMAIWATDLVWTIAGTSDLKMSSNLKRRIFVDPRIDPVSNVPMLSFTCKF
ncbi:MAG: hypothetical protein V2B15_02985 [Bacteroidota bacterium]